MTLEIIATGLERLAARLERIERALGAGAADDDGWTRLPSPRGRCPVSGWSRSTVLRKIADDKVRSKTVGGCRFYAGADVRRLLTQSTEP